MTDILVNVASYILQKPVDLVINELHHLCCFKSFVDNFEDKKGILDAKLKDIEININGARGVSRVKNEAQQWAKEAGDLIKVDTKTKKKWFFDLCPNCWWQYRRGKELAEKTLKIEQLLQRSNSNIVVGPVDVPGIKYHYLNDFIHFESRKLKFQHLMEALQDENCQVIALQGMGGVGKTSLAKEAGVKLEEESKFDKAIFLVVSNPPDFKKTRHEIARHLDLKLEEGKEEELSEKIWSKITNMKEKLLIILDDVWEKFDLRKDIGIPSSRQHKGCSVLITTRISNVCVAMECQKTIQLKTLTDEDALNLFLKHASISDSSSPLKGVAQNIVKQCGGLPVAIVTVASTLKNQNLAVWKEALKSLKNSESLFDANGNERMDYKCLKLSYDNLKNENAKELFLLSSLFLEDFRIPIEVLSRVGIGAGIFGEVVKYSSARSKVLVAVQELIDSCLLLNAEEEYVKMHDLVHEVALQIAYDIQMIMDSKTTTKPNVRCLFWDTEVFPNQFDGRKLEVLLINIDRFKDLNIPDAFFAEMEMLKVLRLTCKFYPKISSSSWLHSLKSLKEIRFLTLMGLKLGDVSTLGKLPTLETLELVNCSIIKLPEEILELKKLKLLEVRRCDIDMSNPFEVIERCSQLEELYFVDNEVGVNEDAVPQNVSRPKLERYQIYDSNFADPFEEYGSISRFFGPCDLRHIISEAMFKQIVGTAELLQLGEYGETRWKNLIPDIVSGEDEGMNDLIILYLKDWPDIQCLIDTRNHNSDITAFSNLVELHLYKMDVQALCLGSQPSGFLEQLKIIQLEACSKLDGILFNDELNLLNLKAIGLYDCPALTSIFQPRTTRSLTQLEELIVSNCPALECIITEQNAGEEIVEENYDLLLPKLKSLEIAGCGKLEMILPVLSSTLEALSISVCEKLKYIFGKYQVRDHALPLFPSLKEMELCGVPSLMDICREYCNLMPAPMQRPSSAVSRDQGASSWAYGCCFLQKRRATSEDTNLPIPPGLHASETVNTTPSIFAMNYNQAWPSLRYIVLENCNIKSFTNLMVGSDKTQLNCKAPKESHASIDRVPPLRTAQSLLVQPFNNVREIELVKCSNLISVLTLPIASTILLETLRIEECHELKSIVADEGDAEALMNYNSIFPRLKLLNVWSCQALEYLFPASVFRSPVHLEGVFIINAPKLKYLFGTSHLEDNLPHENHHIETYYVDFPALRTLQLEDLPNLVSIYPNNYYLMRGLKYIVLKRSPKFIFKSFSDFMICSHARLEDSTTTEELTLQTLEWLTICDIKIEEIFNLTHLKLENSKEETFNQEGPKSLTSSLMCLDLENLSELSNICVGPKDILSLSNLCSLNITACKKLKAVFSASTLRSLPNLWSLDILDCQELVHIIEEDYVENDDNPLHHKQCFPWLRELHVKCCDELKYLFCISLSGVKEASKLEHILIRRGEMKEMVIEDVLPQLYSLHLEELPSLVGVCPGINFQTMQESLEVYIHNCPKFPFYELQASDSENLGSEVQATTKEKPSSHFNTKQLDMGEAKGREDLERQQSIIDSPNFSKKAPTVIDAEGSSTTAPKIFKEEENEEGDQTVPSSQSQVGPKNLNSKVQAPTKEKLSSHFTTNQSYTGKDLETQQSITGSPNFSKDGQVIASGDVAVDRELAHSGGPFVEHDVTMFDDVEVSLPPLPSPLPASMGQAPPFSRTTNPFTIPGVREIVDLMKLEGDEPFMLAKAFETQPKLRLSTEDRSTRMLCLSYRVLLDILNIMATKNPFTITEAEKRSLAENLKDASILGFGKEWLQFIKTKVFDYDLSEVHDTQEVLKCLDDELKTNEAALVTIHDQETVAALAVEAAQSRFDAAQEEYANVKECQTQLLEARHGILARRGQCWEAIAAKYETFGF